VLIQGDCELASKYFIKDGYRERSAPEYFLDPDSGDVWQPDVYPAAADLAVRLGSKTLVDLGCGNALKLVPFHPRFNLVGVDFGANIQYCIDHYGFGGWLEFDFESSETLPIGTPRGTLILCVDVIEHLRRPEMLLRAIAHGMDEGADALILSTPERDLVRGAEDIGPPRNRAHVREWNTDELSCLLEAEHLPPLLSLTRSNDRQPHFHTILAVVPGRGRAESVEEWHHERIRVEKLALQKRSKK
jgi:hypothetical protein